MAKKSRSAGKNQFRELVNRKREQQRRSWIPTAEDFARANALMAARLRIFATVRDEVFRSFVCRVSLHDILLFAGSTTDYEAYVFYESNSDIQACHNSGVEQAIEDAIRQGLASTSDGRLPTVAFKFDSHENVKKQFNGDYRKYRG